MCTVAYTTKDQNIPPGSIGKTRVVVVVVVVTFCPWLAEFYLSLAEIW